jgi:glycosyltransferase involved in cell wall biosynthesis
MQPSLRERIEYAGFVTGEEKINLLSKAKLFVLPSRHESAPISILEAAACAKPVIVSDIPELGFVSESGFGLSFRSGSMDGLAANIDLLLREAETRADMGRKGREYAGQFLWDRLAREFEITLEHTADE